MDHQDDEEITRLEQIDTNDDYKRDLKIQRDIGGFRRAKNFRAKLQELNLQDRVEFVNRAIGLFDNKYYFYAYDHKACVKGREKWYNMKDFEHFVEVFLK